MCHVFMIGKLNSFFELIPMFNKLYTQLHMISKTPFISWFI